MGCTSITHETHLTHGIATASAPVSTCLLVQRLCDLQAFRCPWEAARHKAPLLLHGPAAATPCLLLPGTLRVLHATQQCLVVLWLHEQHRLGRQVKLL